MARIYRRGKVYYSDLYINGKRVRKPLDTDKDIAGKRLGELLELKIANRFGRVPKDVPWSEFKERFLRHVSTKKKSTYQQYQRAIKNLETFRPFLSLSQINPGLLADAVTEWKQKNRGLYVRNRDIQSIKAMMHTAEAWQLIEKQDWRIVKRDREPKGRLLWYTVDDLKKLFKVCHGIWLTVAMLGARAGLRRSEMRWLAWKDVDFERDRIHISPKDDWNPKDFERRWIPLSEDLRDHLWKARNGGEWVIQEDGERPSLGSMTTYFRRLLRKAKLKGSIHTTRHTFGSHLASGGASAKVIKEYMGHSKLEMTDRYMHLSPEAQQSAILRLPSLR